MFFNKNDDDINLPSHLQADYDLIVRKLKEGQSVVFDHINSKDNHLLTIYLNRQLKFMPEFKGKKILYEEVDKISVNSQFEFNNLVKKWRKRNVVVLFDKPEFMLVFLNLTNGVQLKFDKFFQAVAQDKIQFFTTVDKDGRYKNNYEYLRGQWEDFVCWKEFGKNVKETVMESKVVKEHKADIRTFNEHLKLKIIGQDNAIDTIAGTIKKHYAGLSDPQKPIGVFYFVGPSGVGKTELAKQLAKFLYGHEDCMKRIDMSEFSDDVDINRLIGSAPGYVGYERGGALTEWVKKHPKTIVLMDEFEKSHAKCWDICLQLFDAGRLTDGKGDTVDFSKSIIILTSNIGSEYFFEGSLGKTDIQERIHAKMRRIFRPEFLNRIDEIVMFEPLCEQSLNVIAKNVLKKKFPNFKVTESAINFLVKEGYEPAYGVRFLSRAIDDYIVEPFADMIINGHADKKSKLTIDLVNEQITFKR